MDTRTFIIRKTLLLLVVQLLCAAAVCGVFALLDALDRTVILGSAVGAVLAVGDFFLLAVAANHAADQAADQNVKEGKSTIKLSYTARLVALFVLLVVFAKSGLCNPLAMVIPLLLSRPILMVSEFFRKEQKQ